MAHFEIKNLSFTYSASKTKALNEAGVDVAIKPSEIVELLKKVM